MMVDVVALSTARLQLAHSSLGLQLVRAVTLGLERIFLVFLRDLSHRSAGDFNR